MIGSLIGDFTFNCVRSNALTAVAYCSLLWTFLVQIIGWYPTMLEFLAMEGVISPPPRSVRVLELWVSALVQGIFTRMTLAPNLPYFLRRGQPVKDSLLLLLGTVIQVATLLSLGFSAGHIVPALTQFYDGGIDCTPEQYVQPGANLTICQSEFDVPSSVVNNPVAASAIIRSLLQIAIVIFGVGVVTVAQCALWMRVLAQIYRGGEGVNSAAKHIKIKLRHVHQLLTKARDGMPASGLSGSKLERLKSFVKKNPNKGVDDLTYLPPLVWIAHLLSLLSIAAFVVYFCFMSHQWAKTANDLAAEAQNARLIVEATEGFAANSGNFSQQLQRQLEQNEQALNELAKIPGVDSQQLATLNRTQAILSRTLQQTQSISQHLGPAGNIDTAVYTNSAKASLLNAQNFLRTLGMRLPIITVVAALVSLAVSAALLVQGVRQFQRHQRIIRRGEGPATLGPARWLEREFTVSKAMQYCGLQTGSSIFAFLLAFVLALTVLFMITWKDFWLFLIDVGGAAFVPVSVALSIIQVFVLENYVGNRIVSDRYWIKNRHDWTLYSVFMIVLSVITGLFFAVKRFFFLCAFAIASISRLDSTLFPDYAVSLDTGYMAFMSLQMLAHRHQSPVLHAFVHSYSASTGGEFLRSKGAAGDGPLMPASKEGAEQQPQRGATLVPAARIARNRWHLAFSLVRNPSLVSMRGGWKDGDEEPDGGAEAFVENPAAAAPGIEMMAMKTEARAREESGAEAERQPVE
jgi:hypothetical protein